MKLKENFVLRQVADSCVVVAVGAASVDFNGMLTLNESGALLAALTSEYDVDEAQAARDIDEFLSSLRSAGCLEE